MTRRLFRIGETEKNRLEAFSDGVMAIVITLLVLEIHVPEGLSDDAALWRALSGIAPMIAAWVVSFLFVLVLWVNHHYFVTSLRSVDRGFLWLNGLFLLCISATPFPTGLVGAYPRFTAPLVLLSGTMFATSAAFAAMRYYASFPGDLLKSEVGTQQRKQAMRLSMVAPALYGMAGSLAFVWRPASLILLAIVPFLFFLRSPAISKNGAI